MAGINWNWLIFLWCTYYWTFLLGFTRDGRSPLYLEGHHQMIKNFFLYEDLGSKFLEASLPCLSLVFPSARHPWRHLSVKKKIEQKKTVAVNKDLTTPVPEKIWFPPPPTPAILTVTDSPEASQSISGITYLHDHLIGNSWAHPSRCGSLTCFADSRENCCFRDWFFPFSSINQMLSILPSCCTHTRTHI